MLAPTRVVVDGCPAVVQEGLFGTFSPRLRIDFDTPHPVFGAFFMTKYYVLDDDGCTWGDGQRMTWCGEWSSH